MLKKLVSLCILWCAFTAAAPPAKAAPVSIYGAWLCGNDACTWASVLFPDPAGPTISATSGIKSSRQ